METYTALKEFEENPDFEAQRIESLNHLKMSDLDSQIIPAIKKLMMIPYCFTLQSCYGHFVYQSQRDIHNCNQLPKDISLTKIDYRISYIAFCLQNNSKGKSLLNLFKDFKGIDPDYIQCGCAEWFWKRQVNSYVIQITPDRFKYKDRCILKYNEASKVEEIKNNFWKQLMVKL